MYRCFIFLLALLPQQSLAENPNSSAHACDILQQDLMTSNTLFLGNGMLNEDPISIKTFFPGSDVYENDASKFWSRTQVMTPRCIVFPSTPLEIAIVMNAITSTATQFAVRAGGHMAIRGANSVDNGVLIALVSLPISSSRIVIPQREVTGGQLTNLIPNSQTSNP